MGICKGVGFRRFSLPQQLLPQPPPALIFRWVTSRPWSRLNLSSTSGKNGRRARNFFGRKLGAAQFPPRVCGIIFPNFRRREILSGKLKDPPPMGNPVQAEGRQVGHFSSRMTPLPTTATHSATALPVPPGVDAEDWKSLHGSRGDFPEPTTRSRRFGKNKLLEHSDNTQTQTTEPKRRKSGQRAESCPFAVGDHQPRPTVPIYRPHQISQTEPPLPETVSDKNTFWAPFNFSEEDLFVPSDWLTGEPQNGQSSTPLSSPPSPPGIRSLSSPSPPHRSIHFIPDNNSYNLITPISNYEHAPPPVCMGRGKRLQ